MLAASRAAALVVSHDRAFLERVTQRCFWLEDRRIWRLDTGFAAFDAWSARIAADQAESLRRLSKAIERETYTFYPLDHRPAHPQRRPGAGPGGDGASASRSMMHDQRRFALAGGLRRAALLASGWSRPRASARRTASGC